jgi:hypothetical protein
VSQAREIRVRRKSKHTAARRYRAQRVATQNMEVNMRQVKVWIEGIPGSPYSQSGQLHEPFLERESHEDYDTRLWRNKCTTNDDGQVCIPSMALKQAIDTAAYKLGHKVPGRKGATYKNFFGLWLYRLRKRADRKRQDAYAAGRENGHDP